MSKAAVLLVILVTLWLPLIVAQSQTNTVHACVASNGAVRIVDANTNCAAGEQQITWNVQGPPGPAGPQGEQGVPGSKGD